MPECNLLIQIELPVRHEPFAITGLVADALSHFVQEYKCKPATIELNPYILEMFKGVNSLQGVPLTSDHFVFRNQIRFTFDRSTEEIIDAKRKARNVTTPS